MRPLARELDDWHQPTRSADGGQGASGIAQGSGARFLPCEPLVGPVDLLIDGECSTWRCPECGSRTSIQKATRRKTVELVALRTSVIPTGRLARTDWKSGDRLGSSAASGPKRAVMSWIWSIVGHCTKGGVAWVKQLRPVAQSATLAGWAEEQGWHLTHDGQDAIDNDGPLSKGPRLVSKLRDRKWR